MAVLYLQLKLTKTPGSPVAGCSRGSRTGCAARVDFWNQDLGAQPLALTAAAELAGPGPAPLADARDVLLQHIARRGCSRRRVADGFGGAGGSCYCRSAGIMNRIGTATLTGPGSTPWA